MSKLKTEKLTPVEVILSPAMQAQTVADVGTIQTLVAREVAEILAKSDSAVFEPYFRTRHVAYELRRLQSIPQQRVHSVRYKRFGCMICYGTERPHGGLGMCDRCYAREFQLRKRLIRELEGEGKS
jgi:hypothetical protein